MTNLLRVPLNQVIASCSELHSALLLPPLAGLQTETSVALNLFQRRGEAQLPEAFRMCLLLGFTKMFADATAGELNGKEKWCWMTLWAHLLICPVHRWIMITANSADYWILMWYNCRIMLYDVSLLNSRCDSLVSFSLMDKNFVSFRLKVNQLRVNWEVKLWASLFIHFFGDSYARG